MAFHSSQSFHRGLSVSLLLLFTLGLPSGCRCVGSSKQYVTANRGGDGDGFNRLRKWESAVPTYALNWGQHQGTTEDLLGADLEGVYGENDFLASWAAPAFDSGLDSIDFWYVIKDDIKNFKSNPCAPGRDCTFYGQVGYVFNSMTL